MAGSYKDLEREFRGMDQEYREYLGLIGLRHVVNETTDAIDRRNYQPPRQRNENSFDPVGNMKYNQQDQMNDFSNQEDQTELTDESIISLVDRMRATVFKFKITNAFDAIISPLRTELDRLSFEEAQMVSKHHMEDNLYYQSMVTAIEGLSKSVETNMVRSLLMEYQRFTRHPVWASMRYINAGLIQPVATGIKTMLFGWKKEKSDTDRIVDSINELTEFMMTGQIDRTESFMDKYIRKGLVQSIGERLGNVVGVSREGAQRIEDMKFAGKGAYIEDVMKAYKQGGMSALQNAEQRQLVKDVLSSKIYSTIIKRGRMVGPNGVEGGEDQNSLTLFESQSINLLTSIKTSLEQLTQMTNIMLIGAMENSIKMQDFFTDYERSTMSMFETVAVKQAKEINSSIHGASASIIKQHKESIILQGEILESNEDIEKHTKDTAKRVRRGFGSLIAVIGVAVAGAIVSMSKGIIGAIKSLIPYLAVRGGKAIPTPTGGTGGNDSSNKKGGRIGAIGGLLGKLLLPLSVGLAAYDNVDAVSDTYKELDKQGTGLFKMGTTIAVTATRGIVGSMLEGTTSIVASAFDLVTGSDQGQQLQDKFSNGFIARLKSSPNFPFLGKNWWTGIFDELSSANFWEFDNSYAGNVIKKISDGLTAIDNKQFNSSMKAMENIDSMYDSMNSLYTPTNKKAAETPASTLKPVVEMQEKISSSTMKLLNELSDKQISVSEIQAESNQKLSEAVDGLKTELKMLNKSFKEGNKSSSVFGFDTDALLNKIGL